MSAGRADLHGIGERAVLPLYEHAEAIFARHSQVVAVVVVELPSDVYMGDLTGIRFFLTRGGGAVDSTSHGSSGRFAAASF